MKEFTKSDLKPGQVVETANEGAYMALNMPFGDAERMILMGVDGFLYLTSYNEDLTRNDKYKTYDIVKVYDTSGHYGLGFSIIHYLESFSVIWERH